jgi:hypothetical protein
MKAISIREPWASMFLAQGRSRKSIEVRSWRTKHRGPLLLCACKSPKGPLAGQAFAIADLTECRPMTRRDKPRAKVYRKGHYAWCLSCVIPIEPFPVSGKQGFFNVKI